MLFKDTESIRKETMSNAVKRIRVENENATVVTTMTDSLKMQPQRAQTNLTSIITENITPEFGKLSYLGFSLIIKRANGYINATHLCAQSEKKRELKNWTQLNMSKEIIEDLSTHAGIQASDLTQTVAGGQITEIRGTYVHPMLVPVIAQWASPRFRTRVAIILENEAVRDYKEQIRQKDDKIDELKVMLEDQKKMMEEQKLMLVESKETNRIQQEKMDELLGYSKYTKDKLDDMHVSINNIGEDTVVVESKVDEIREAVTEHVVAPAPKTPSKQHGYVVVRVRDDTYKTIRRQITGLKTACAKVLRENPGARVVFEAKPCANAVSLNTRVTEALRDHPHVRIRYQSIEITNLDAYSEDDLLATLRDVYDKCTNHVEKIEAIKTKLDVINKTIVEAKA